MRLALFGGTFDPVHNAHLTVAREAADQFHLDQVWFVPAAHPPHKVGQMVASYEDRYRMVDLACQADSRFRSVTPRGRSATELLHRYGRESSGHGRRTVLHHRRGCLRGTRQLASLAGLGCDHRIYCRNAPGARLYGPRRSARASARHCGAAGFIVRDSTPLGAGRESSRAAAPRWPPTSRRRLCIDLRRRWQADDGKQLLRRIQGPRQGLVDKIKSLVHEGNVRRIILKDEKATPFSKSR